MHFLHSMYSYGIPVFHKARWSVIQAWLGTTVQGSSTASVSVIFSFFPLYTVGKTIFLWVSLSSPHKQNGTIQWGNQGYHSQSFLHRILGDRDSMLVHWDPPACPGHQKHE